MKLVGPNEKIIFEIPIYSCNEKEFEKKIEEKVNGTRPE